ncbi:hypothetical protein ACFYTQ_17265 [Nocardia sp. NPDC004068]|uniref:hypothetical protein n=1 Tax=Nocardia sp. NPDC004068 TaxID=3364303 RepID=UPI00368D392C
MPAAVGLIRIDLSDNVNRDKALIRDRATREGLDLVEGLVFTATTDMPTTRVMEAVTKHKATTVIVPTVAHLGRGHHPVVAAGVRLLCTRPVGDRTRA